MPPLLLCSARLLTPAEEISGAALLIEDGKIAAAGRRAAMTVPPGAEMFDAGEWTVAPGFVDIHIHGAGGHDVMEGSAEALHAVAATLARHGTTALLATTASASIDSTCLSVERIAAFLRNEQRSAPPAARFLGIHLEGPFLNRARRGVHPEQWIAPPSLHAFRRITSAAGEAARILTLAPEVPGGLELVDAARAAGLVVALGHTDATYDQAVAAIARGARHAVHVFNAMRPFSHRETGVLGAVLTSPEVTAEVIADGVHVDAPAIRLLLAAKGVERIVLATDATSATGMPDGRYPLGPFELFVSGGVCRDSEGRLAGSTLTLDRAVRHMVRLGVPLAHAVQMATLNPARVLGLEARKGQLAPGADADLVLLDADLHVRRVMIGGAWL